MVGNDHPLVLDFFKQKGDHCRPFQLTVYCYFSHNLI